MHIRKYDVDYSRRFFLEKTAKGAMGAGVLTSLWPLIGNTGEIGKAYPEELQSLEAYTKGKVKEGVGRASQPPVPTAMASRCSGSHHGDDFALDRGLDNPRAEPNLLLYLMRTIRPEWPTMKTPDSESPRDWYQR